MVKHEEQYRAFIRTRGVGANDRVASSPDSYVSYLQSVSRLLHEDITPGTLRTEQDIHSFAKRLDGKRAQKTIDNYCSAMRQYIAFVLENRL